MPSKTIYKVCQIFLTSFIIGNWLEYIKWDVSLKHKLRKTLLLLIDQYNQDMFLKVPLINAGHSKLFSKYLY